MSRLRIEVEGADGGCIVTVDTSILDRLTDDQRAALDTAIATLIENAEDVVGGPSEVAADLVVHLAQRKHDAAAYDREAQRRGVLPL